LRRGGLFLAVVLPLLALSVPAATQTLQLTDEEVCELIPAYEGVAGAGWYDTDWGEPNESQWARCSYTLPGPVTEDSVLNIHVTLHSGREAAQEGFEWVSGVIVESGGAATPVDIGDAARHWAWNPDWDPNRQLYETLVAVGPFVIRVTGNNVDTLPAAREVAAAAALLVPATTTTTTTASTTTAPPGLISHDITVVDGVIHLVSPPGGTLVISRQDLPEWARDAIATVGDAYVRIGPPGILSQGDPSVLLDGLPVVRVGDGTPTGGRVTEGTPLILVNGVPAALVGGFVADPMITGPVPAVGGSILGRGNPCGTTRTDFWGQVVCETTYPYPHGFLAEEARRGATRIQLGTGEGQIRVGDAVVIGDHDDTVEVARVAAEGSLILDRPLAHDHAAGALVVRIPDEYAGLVEPTGAAPVEPGGGAAWVVVIASAVGSLAAVALLVLWLRRRASAALKPAQPPPPPPPPPA
jgi:uncharacterized Zn-binding protein involved in type VI secretion